jgi:hypothetical protein
MRPTADSPPHQLRVLRHFVEDGNTLVAILSYSLSMDSDNETRIDPIVPWASEPRAESPPDGLSHGKQAMKLVVINFSGNVGKTTVVAHLLKPRMAEAQVFSVESLNLDAAASGVDVERLRGRKFGSLNNQVMLLDSAIVDVGASNVEDFLKLMRQYHGSHNDFDHFVVPVVREKKQQVDTINTITELAKLGVPNDRIRVVLNKVDPEDDVEDEFHMLFHLERQQRSFTLNPDAVIYTNEVFDLLQAAGMSLPDITGDPTDYRAKLREAKDPEYKDYCLRMVALKRLAVTANHNLDEAFEALFA